MTNKIKAKKVGRVDIFEPEGLFTGRFASLTQYAFDQYERNFLMVNASKIQEIDRVGGGILAATLGSAKKGAVLRGSMAVEEMLRGVHADSNVKFLKDEDEAAWFFTREFAIPPEQSAGIEEKREFIRLRTVLPMHFWLDRESTDGPRSFFGVVTNLSEGGLFTEFIESRSEEESKKYLNPYDLRLLRLKVYLPNRAPLEVAGKMIHGSYEGGIGISFYGATDEQRDYVSQWIEEHLIQNEGLE